MPIKTLPKSIPNSPGVYTFRRGKEFLYVGKAVDLKRRLVSYFRKNVIWKVVSLLKEATKLDWIETSSEIAAFIKESELIKKYRPKFNYQFRDDKNYFYVGTTKEEFPRIFITHQLTKGKNYLGPFTSGKALKTTLRLLRRIFPYCTCKTLHKRPCLNSEIGRCLNVCCVKNYRGPISIVDEYHQNIKNIIKILNGKSKKLIRELRGRMRELSTKQDFEKAAIARDQIVGLENVFSHRQLLEVRLPAGNRTSWRNVKKALQSILGTTQEISRVEGYDISNISGTEATGSMVVFIDGYPAKSEYRKFKIKTVQGSNDVKMLKEVIKRRLAHPEWPYPDLMLIDGGKAQLNVAIATSKFKVPAKGGSASGGKSLKFKVAALAKREEELYTENIKSPVRLDSLPHHMANFLKHIRDESHRFAKKYHHKLREVAYRGQRSKD